MKAQDKNKPLKSGGIDQQSELRYTKSKTLIKELQKLYGFMTKSNKMYANPTAVLKSLVDDYGNPIQIGEQKDIGEFNSTFLARIHDGLHADQILSNLRLKAKLDEEKKVDIVVE